jgi:hypothetical protein
MSVGRGVPNDVKRSGHSALAPTLVLLLAGQTRTRAEPDWRWLDEVRAAALDDLMNDNGRALEFADEALRRSPGLRAALRIRAAALPHVRPGH